MLVWETMRDDEEGGDWGNVIVLTIITISTIVNITYMVHQGLPSTAQIDKSDLIYSDINQKSNLSTHSISHYRLGHFKNNIKNIQHRNH